MFDVRLLDTSKVTLSDKNWRMLWLALSFSPKLALGLLHAAVV